LTDDVQYLDLDDLLILAQGLLGDPVPIRDVGILEAAAARPRASAFGEDVYPDVLTKAAAFLQSVVKGHALVDGNKRLGWLATYVFLRINGYPMRTARPDDVVTFVEGIAASNDEVDVIAERLRQLLS
jgi:death-on-curing protein